MAELKDVVWLGSSKDDLEEMPREVVSEVGHNLYVAQQGRKPDDAKPLKGYGGASVLEIVENFDKDTYRAVYTVEFREAKVSSTASRRNRSAVRRRRSRTST